MRYRCAVRMERLRCRGSGFAGAVVVGVALVSASAGADIVCLDEPLRFHPPPGTFIPRGPTAGSGAAAPQHDSVRVRSHHFELLAPEIAAHMLKGQCLVRLVILRPQ